MRKMLVAVLAVVAVGCGGGVKQSDECIKWIKCYDASTGSTKGSQDAAFGPMGTCWTNGATTESAKVCTDSCKSSTTSYAALTGAPADCK